MRLQEPSKLLKLWTYALERDANVVLIRHAPKAGGNNSYLSEEGERLAMAYGVIFGSALKAKQFALSCTSKNRTVQTLKLLFPIFDSTTYLYPFDLEVNKVTPSVQEQCDKLHMEVGFFRGYYGNHTYYFLEKLGGQFDEENIHTIIAKRMARGIRALFDLKQLVIYCGHSPSIEAGLETLLGLTLSELGGFLNPLDSIHLRLKENKIEWIARINPIADYIDLENEVCFKNKF